MAERGIISKSILTNIADAIRAKNGSTALMTPPEMPGLIDELENKAEFVQTDLTSINTIRGAVCYGNGIFVAIKATAAYYSTDGINWTETTVPAQQLWSCVCYGNGVFVVAGGNNTLYSTDGINWTETSAGFYSQTSLCFGNGKFIAGFHQSMSSAIGISTDGINWQWNRGVATYVSAICYGGGKYVQFCTGTSDGSLAVAGYSTDGINWTETTLPLSQNWSAACFGKGTFVALARNSQYGVFSTDGINWTQMEMPSSQEWHRVCYGNGMFVAIAQNTDAAAYSMDGINWTAFTMPSSGIWLDLCYGDGKFVAAGQNMPAVVCDVRKSIA